MQYCTIVAHTNMLLVNARMLAMDEQQFIPIITVLSIGMGVAMCEQRLIPPLVNEGALNHGPVYGMPNACYKL